MILLSARPSSEDGFRTFLVVLFTRILPFRNCCVSIYSKFETKVDGGWGSNTVVHIYIRLVVRLDFHH